MTEKKYLKNIIISRTDSIGDVVLTLPVTQILKKHFPGIRIAFLAKAYTKPVIDACIYVDQFIDINDFLEKKILINGEQPQAILHVFPVSIIAKRAKQLKIPLRIGTTGRIYHWLNCNRLVNLSRKKSDLHESQLNLKLLKALGIEDNTSLGEMSYLFGLERLEPLDNAFARLITPEKYNLILHPKSQGSAREWGLDNFIKLVELLAPSQFTIFISGTEKERELLQPLFDAVGNRVTDITGTMSLGQFISFINACNGLVANSTGPLHIAAALGKDAMGIYPPMRPIHPGRWAPVGAHAKYFVVDKYCEDCKGNRVPCICIKSVPPVSIKKALMNYSGNKV